MGYKTLIKIFNILPKKAIWFIVERLWPSIQPATSRIKIMVDNFSFENRSGHILYLSLTLRGEATPITAEINIKNLSSNHWINVSEIHFSREWLNLLVKNFAPEIIKGLGWEMKGEQILIPEGVVNAFNKIVN